MHISIPIRSICFLQSPVCSQVQHTRIQSRREREREREIRCLRSRSFVSDSERGISACRRTNDRERERLFACCAHKSPRLLSLSILQLLFLPQCRSIIHKYLTSSMLQCSIRPIIEYWLVYTRNTSGNQTNMKFNLYGK